VDGWVDHFDGFIGIGALVVCLVVVCYDFLLVAIGDSSHFPSLSSSFFFSFLKFLV